MAKINERVRVTLAGDDFYPQAFLWAGRSIRVLFVEGMSTTGAERVFRVRTLEGVFELAQQTVTESWFLRRQPSWWDRALGQGGGAARYEPVAGRNRISRAEARARFARQQRREEQGHSSEGGGYASGPAVV